MNIVIVQHGDYGSAYARLRAGEPETYVNQKHSVDFVASLTGPHVVTTIAACEREHDEILADGLRSVGLGVDGFFGNPERFHRLLASLEPDIVVARTPNPHLFHWLADRGVPVLPELADTFSQTTAVERWRTWRFAWILARACFPCVANHSLSASISVRRLGVPDELIVPREQRALEAVEPPKPGPGPAPFRVFYAGAMVEGKGVPELIDAIAISNRRRPGEMVANLAGPGQLEPWRAHARAAGVEKQVRFLGLVSAARVREEMRTHDAVVVPSRHDYQEGLPNTMCEALASRTPVVVSDHPSFIKRLRPDRDALVSRAGSAKALADALDRLRRTPDLYRRLSERGRATLESLYVGWEWSELIRAFVDDPTNRSGWVASHSLGALLRRRPELDDPRVPRASRAKWGMTRRAARALRRPVW